MTTRIADLRSVIRDMAGACARFKEYAVLCASLAFQDARVKLRLAKIKADHDSATAELRGGIEQEKSALATFITAHQEQFVKPRKVKTDFGTFGLETETELVITDEEAMINELRERGYQDCLETVWKPVKTAIRKRIEAGEIIPGCQVNTGDTAVCRVSSDILKEAAAKAEAA